MPTENEPKVEITLKEVYDIVMATHVVVTGFGPRLTAVENTVGKALALAQAADSRSRENRRYLTWIGRTTVTIVTGGIVALIGAWTTGHLK